jgi:hypothetical protein
VDDPEQNSADEDEGEELEAMIERADHAFGTESPGTTAEEQEEGESLDQRLAEERPDTPATEDDLAIVDDGVTDDEAELVGDAVRQHDRFAPPEEAALTVRDSPPGATDHEDRHPEEEDRQPRNSDLEQ